MHNRGAHAAHGGFSHLTASIRFASGHAGRSAFAAITTSVGLWEGESGPSICSCDQTDMNSRSGQ